MKPDVVAPGTHITGASPQHGGYSGAGVCNAAFAGSAFYSLVSGTSQAAPQVSGAAALLRDWYVRTVNPQPPSPAMTKAMLVNTATDLDGGDSGKGSRDPAGAEHGRGLGPRGRGRRARRHAARVRGPGHRPRRGRPELPALLLGRGHVAPRADHARLDRPAAGDRDGQRVRERPRPRGERRRPDLPRQLAGRRPVRTGRPGRLPQQPRERGAARRARPGGCR